MAQAVEPIGLHLAERVCSFSNLVGAGWTARRRAHSVRQYLPTTTKRFRKVSDDLHDSFSSTHPLDRRRYLRRGACGAAFAMFAVFVGVD